MTTENETPSVTENSSETPAVTVKPTVITVRMRDTGQQNRTVRSQVSSTDTPAQTAERPRHENKKKDRKPGRQFQQFQSFQSAPAKKAPVAVPTGELGVLIALAKTTLNPGNMSSLEEMGARFRARTDEKAIGIAATIQALVAKADVGTGPSVAEALAAVNTKLAAFKPTAVTEAAELIMLRAKKAELEARDAKVKSDGARYAGLCGKAKRAAEKASTADEAAKPGLEVEAKAFETDRDALKTAIDAEKAAIAAERETFGENGSKLTHCEDIAMFRSDDTPPFAQCLELVAERDRLAVEGPGLTANLGEAIAAYKTRLNELSEKK